MITIGGRENLIILMMYDKMPTPVLEYLFSTLKEREAYCLRKRYVEIVPIKTIAQNLGITTSRVYQIIDHALRKLNHPARWRQLNENIKIGLYSIAKSMKSELRRILV